MSITLKRKRELIQEYASSEKDTGSPEVQIAVCCERIANLTKHFKNAKKDVNSKIGLSKLIALRNSLLKYLERKDVERYKKLVSSLGLRR
ncbi:30S ribosomal protein S15 [Candidatus Liberibacter africanus]|uniref:Small ribosomal subunit protein uS15 n=1 Tax=Candidatus Liberibacter africanus PTSAPSY TaxID=1277257 RepID=A0A0G3I2L1_LIBAF|nr:30S ribosomal protein S15 [Candidatus Liberibacter africanus]AKK20126.1 30S ribosomal protein S15 [Candidatus Liberibacter africanus PTSAPSY]QTP63932.1 30S ribosomal protein S15 [Candidatus Liberibacter africanus]